MTKSKKNYTTCPDQNWKKLQELTTYQGHGKLNFLKNREIITSETTFSLWTKFLEGSIELSALLTALDHLVDSLEQDIELLHRKYRETRCTLRYRDDKILEIKLKIMLIKGERFKKGIKQILTDVDTISSMFKIPFEQALHHRTRKMGCVGVAMQARKSGKTNFRAVI
ncbi:hypothetical protein AGMMS50249_6020 [candidate division SR1 bacterium]|nr:hypothetical protein AGMMS50249_6020 [candidate division SR1 bacterium]